MYNPYIEIKYGKYGRGLYAKCDIKKDTIIEKSPILEVPEIENSLVDGTVFNNYTFFISEKNKNKQGLVLGIGSLFNHSINSNIFVKKTIEKIEDTTTTNLKKDCLFFEFVVKNDIYFGEELTINYGYDVQSQNKTYFNKRKKILKELNNA